MAINAEMRLHDYFILGKTNGYGQLVMPTDEDVAVGQIKMAIFVTSQSVQDNINYKDAQYVGLTFAKVDDTYIIQNGKERLKVLYVNNMGRLNQVFMSKI